jgi:cell wall-associated NlpC family hydrolase
MGMALARAGSVAAERMVTLGQWAGTASAAPSASFGQAGAAPAGAAPAGGVAAFQGLGQVTGQVSGVIAAAEKYLGVPYKWGGTNPATGLDCSGFVQRVYADLGISLPRVSVDQARQGTKVPSMDQAQPGDLVFWRGSPNHIGIYAGDGQMIVAPRTGDVVKYQKITRTPHEIRRIT